MHKHRRRPLAKTAKELKVSLLLKQHELLPQVVETTLSIRVRHTVLQRPQILTLYPNELLKEIVGSLLASLARVGSRLVEQLSNASIHNLAVLAVRPVVAASAKDEREGKGWRRFRVMLVVLSVHHEWAGWHRMARRVGVAAGLHTARGRPSCISTCSRRERRVQHKAVFCRAVRNEPIHPQHHLLQQHVLSVCAVKVRPSVGTQPKDDDRVGRGEPVVRLSVKVQPLKVGKAHGIPVSSRLVSQGRRKVGQVTTDTVKTFPPPVRRVPLHLPAVSAKGWRALGRVDDGYPAQPRRCQVKDATAVADGRRRRPHRSRDNVASRKGEVRHVEVVSKEVCSCLRSHRPRGDAKHSVE
mmetsp:Transcript_13720/g.43161  ORF Transcript_13720/g.43161 Transcript_13720/m.43161 type:complete len:355 (-) Transcript_13720:2151-3215(-)